MGCEAQALDPKRKGDARLDAAGVIPDIAVRLADEGVPLRAIARATRISSADLRERLRLAQAAGQLLDLPREDWPPGFPRDQRALQLSRLVMENRDQLLIAMQQVFGLTPTEIELLLMLVQHPTLFTDRISDVMTSRTVYVHVCAIRKRLEPYGIEIQTLWGHGYQFASKDRHKVMDIILHRASGQRQQPVKTGVALAPARVVAP